MINFIVIRPGGTYTIIKPKHYSWVWVMKKATLDVRANLTVDGTLYNQGTIITNGARIFVGPEKVEQELDDVGGIRAKKLLMP